MEVCPRNVENTASNTGEEALAESVKSFVERKNDKGQDTFDVSDWWKANCAKRPAFTYVLRAVLTTSPNSCPPERLFSMFNSTFNDDQKRFHRVSRRLHEGSIDLEIAFLSRFVKILWIIFSQSRVV